MQAWPFLISAKRDGDYAPVVVPDFIKTSSAEADIMRAAKGFLTEPGEAIYFKGRHKKLGVVDMVFRVFPEDRAITGVVLNEDHSGDGFTQAQLDAARDLVTADLEEFSRCEGVWEPKVSAGREFEAGNGEPLRLKRKNSRSAAETRKRTAAPPEPAEEIAAAVAEPEIVAAGPAVEMQPEPKSIAVESAVGDRQSVATAHRVYPPAPQWLERILSPRVKARAAG